VFSTEIERAIRVSISAHAGQVRKSSDVPYVSHPLHVALMLARVGASEETIQAGLLHDVVEDCEDWTLGRVQEEFGADVRELVAAVTEDKNLSWEERKQSQIDHVEQMDERALLIKAADKLHNLSSLLADLEQSEDPNDIWRHFSRGPEATIQTAEQLVSALVSRLPSGARQLSEQLERTVESLRAFG
jgi:(p)ppGpp synthase/HD superfamily hydrolase